MGDITRSKLARTIVLTGYIVALVTVSLVHNHAEILHPLCLCPPVANPTPCGKLNWTGSTVKPFFCGSGPECVVLAGGDNCVASAANLTAGRRSQPATILHSSYCPSCDFLSIKILVSGCDLGIVTNRAGWRERGSDYVAPYPLRLEPCRVRSPPVAELV
jgi:hypothetical protein